jgi:TIR domain-containing protein
MNSRLYCLPKCSSEPLLSALTEAPELVGFFSYSREDDRDSEGALTRLRRRIQSELSGQLGRSDRSLRLFQDEEAIPPGTLWEAEISTAIEQSAFFIPIITPRVIQSEQCGVEFRKFLEREKAIGRTDLIFPILYIDVPALHERNWRSHPTLGVIGARQYVNWCDYRFEPDGPQVRRAIALFCTKVAAALSRNVVVRPIASTAAVVSAPSSLKPELRPKPQIAVTEQVNSTPSPASLVEPPDEPSGSSELLALVPKPRVTGTSGNLLMLQGVVLSIGLGTYIPSELQLILSVTAVGLLVVGFIAWRSQTVVNVRLSLCASLLGLLTCVACLVAAYYLRLAPVLNLIGGVGIVLCLAAAVLSIIALRRLRVANLVNGGAPA